MGEYPEKWIAIHATQFIRAASGESTLRTRKSWHLEKLMEPPGQNSIRLNDQFRMFLRFEGHGDARTVVIVSVRDPH